MKKYLALFILTLNILPIYASEDLDLYFWLFDQAQTVQEQYALIKSYAGLKQEDDGSLYMRALERLNARYKDLKTTSERNTADEMAKILCIELGSLKYRSAARQIWQIAEISQSPATKAEACIALGRIRSEEHLPFLIKMLNDLNKKAPSHRRDGEVLVYGLLLGLEKYNSPEAYEPVFFAAHGWYSKKTKDIAKKVLRNLLDDPTDSLIEIIKKNDIEIKLLAVETSEASVAPEARKRTLATYAYKDAWAQASVKGLERSAYTLYRKKALSLLLLYGLEEELVPLIDRSYREGEDLEEKLNAIQALARSSSEMATDFLVHYLHDMNARRKAGLVNQSDERLVRSLIPALGVTGKERAKVPLLVVEEMGWQPAVIKLASEALKKLP